MMAIIMMMMMMILKRKKGCQNPLTLFTPSFLQPIYAEGGGRCGLSSDFQGKHCWSTQKNEKIKLRPKHR